MFQLCVTSVQIAVNYVSFTAAVRAVRGETQTASGAAGGVSLAS